MRILLAAMILVAGSVTLSAQSMLTTTFANNNGQTGNMFDVKALTSLTIDSFDVNFTGATGDFEVWALNFTGGYLGNESSNANWTLLGTALGITGNGAGTASPLGLSLNFPILAGDTQAFYVTGINGTGVQYTNGTTTGNLFTSNADIEFYEGHGGGYFALTFNPRIWNGNIHYTLAPTVADDIGVTKFTSPVPNTSDCSALTTTETVTVEVRNFGMNTIPSATGLILLALTVDGLPLITDPIFPAVDFNSGDVISHTFTTTADLSALGNHTLSVVATISGVTDLNTSNNTLATNITSGGLLRIDTFPYVEDFTLVGNNGSTIPPLGWIQESTDGTGTNSDWLLRNDSTPSANTGPAADHTTGVAGTGGYAYVEDAGNFGAVILRSPCFDLSGLINPSLRFFMHSMNSLGTTGNTLSVDLISYPSGAITTDVFGPQGHLGTNWEMQAVDLNAFVGDTVQFLFRGTSTTGTLHDIAIDDVTVIELQPTNGQGPTPGQAVFDLNDSRNVNFDLLAFGFKGPYFTNVTAGDVLLMKMEGEPNQSVVLLSGPLNSTNASFPGVGIMDIGTTLNPTTGVPMGLSIVADGTAPGLFNDLFDTGPAGSTEIGFTVPSLPPGSLGGFQCIFYRNGAIPIALSNAVELIVM